MEFEYSDSFYISEKDLSNMSVLAKENNDIWMGINLIVDGWDDCDYYLFYEVQDQVYDYIKKHLTN